MLFRLFVYWFTWLVFVSLTAIPMCPVRRSMCDDFR